MKERSTQPDDRVLLFADSLQEVGFPVSLQVTDIAAMIDGLFNPDKPGVFFQIAQDIGHLQGVTQCQRQSFGFGIGAVEHPDRQQPDRSRYASAIDLERVQWRCTERRSQIHRHAVDDGL